MNEKRLIAIAGNPNVGKSTIFNALTGMNQHTGNWPGKTVEKAEGSFSFRGHEYLLVDLPGTYSLFAHSTEEEVARDFICFGGAGIILIVCDATCLERNLNLVLQTIEISANVIVCVNLMDEARKKKIHIDLERLEELLGVRVIGTAARSKKGTRDVLSQLDISWDTKNIHPVKIIYPQEVERAINLLEPLFPDETIPNARWLSLRLLEGQDSMGEELKKYLDSFPDKEILYEMQKQARELLEEEGIGRELLEDKIIDHVVEQAEQIAAKTVSCEKKDFRQMDRKFDQVLTNKLTGIPIMLLLLCFIFWITISGANIPSELLSNILFQGEEILASFLTGIRIPAWLCEMFAHGIYRVLAWVISVMLPPMAIFFPLFTLLEDLGYLPRVAFNLDHCFKRACTCGKQALTMCMGFGCNAVGVTGCRIIDSPRERLIAMITNSFVPCNGRFPTLIALITIFFINVQGVEGSILSALALTGMVFLGILFTFIASRLLSATVLKGMPSSFTLELPPYRKPQVGKVIVRSIFDRTLFVLGRAAMVAAPAGLIIWLLANVQIGDASLLIHCAQFLDPFGRLLGMDGVILLAFILGFPANEIVVPIIIMAYMSTGSLVELEMGQLHTLLAGQGWTWLTALCTMIFCLFHWPCSTTCLTIKKESQSLKWTMISFLLPTLFGIVICFLIASTARLFGAA